jgi:hypothetical protein
MDKNENKENSIRYAGRHIDVDIKCDPFLRLEPEESQPQESSKRRDEKNIVVDKYGKTCDPMMGLRLEPEESQPELESDKGKDPNNKISIAVDKYRKTCDTMMGLGLERSISVAHKYGKTCDHVMGLRLEPEESQPSQESDERKYPNDKIRAAVDNIRKTYNTCEPTTGLRIDASSIASDKYDTTCTPMMGLRLELEEIQPQESDERKDSNDKISVAVDKFGEACNPTMGLRPETKSIVADKYESACNPIMSLRLKEPEQSQPAQESDENSIVVDKYGKSWESC